LGLEPQKGLALGREIELRTLAFGEHRRSGRIARQKGVPTPPTLANGKIFYLEIPSIDIARSAEFYSKVFGWKTRRRGDGSIAFDDGVGQVSGTWVLGRPPQSAPGLLIYIMMDDAAAISVALVASGGEIVQPMRKDSPEIIARFRDLSGNVPGIYQERSLAKSAPESS